MARLKQTVMQRSYSYMELREDFLERDDVEIRGRSLRGARNMRALATEVVEARPGLAYIRALEDAENAFEIRPATGQRFGVILFNNRLEVINIFGDQVYTRIAVPWTDAREVWFNTFRNKVLIGSKTGGIRVLKLENDVWSFDAFQFEEASGGERAQPYWAYETDTTLQPSATAGSITLTASREIWTQNYVGLRVRYGQREVQITERINSLVVRGNVVNELPPSFRITVSNSDGFRIGDVVSGGDTNYNGQIIAISGNDLDVATLQFFEGPDVGEDLSAPSASSEVTGKTTISPLASPVWDEPLMSDARGWPGASSSASGRVIFIDFPQVPDVIALSSSRAIEDFNVGAADDDAIVRQVGDSSPRWLHAVNIGDLILLSDNGVYNVPIRETGVISPSTFNPVFVDDAASSEFTPVKVEDGVVFIDSSGENIKMVMLDGNIYLKWSVRDITELHSHLIKTPVALCGPSLGSAAAEKYVFVINSDGTIAALSWQESLRDETAGFAPWDTEGKFRWVSPMFDGYWAIVERQIDGQTRRYLERFDDDMVVDSGIEATTLSEVGNFTVNGNAFTANGQSLEVISPYMDHLGGETVAYFIENWDAGDFLVNTDGTIVDEPTQAGTRQVGLNFTAGVDLWPVESIESQRIGTLKARVLELVVSVQNTLSFTAVCNRTERTIAAYSFGDDLSAPPALKTNVYRFPVFGNRDNPTLKVEKRRPGKFRVLATGQRVQA